MKWNNQTKEVITYLFAFLSLLGGFGLTIAGFIVDPTGQVHDSVLWILAQALTFTGAIIGINLHIKRGLQDITSEIKSEVKEHLNKQKEDKDTDKDS